MPAPFNTIDLTTLALKSGEASRVDVELEDPRGSEGDRLDRGLLQLVVAGNVGADHLRVGGGSEVVLLGWFVG